MIAPERERSLTIGVKNGNLIPANRLAEEFFMRIVLSVLIAGVLLAAAPPAEAQRGGECSRNCDWKRDHGDHRRDDDRWGRRDHDWNGHRDRRWDDYRGRGEVRFVIRIPLSGIGFGGRGGQPYCDLGGQLVWVNGRLMCRYESYGGYW